MHIVYISDGKAGHRSQALGLFQAIQKQQQAILTEIPIQDLAIFSLLQKILTAQALSSLSPPTFIIGVGSHTHLRVWLLGKIYPQAKTVILMKPGLPIGLFDYAIIPAHDGRISRHNVLLTQGALNPIENQHRHQIHRVLIALGGHSKRHRWNDDKVMQTIEQIIQNNPQADVWLTTSRRTPAEFLQKLRQHTVASALQIFPVEQTAQGWIFEQMQLAQAVWVTEDSVSMMYEALTAGCQVGVILVDRVKQDRITQSVDDLLQQQIVSTTTQLAQLPQAKTFKEAERVATYLLKSYSGN
ncbi:MAG: ELM1/GtrOC1 family putative glycosyltransferase [Acinetobacter sp.]